MSKKVPLKTSFVTLYLSQVFLKFIDIIKNENATDSNIKNRVTTVCLSGPLYVSEACTIKPAKP